MISQEISNSFTELLSNDILLKLNGTHPKFDRIETPDKPSKIIVIGTLGDKSTDYSINEDEKRTSSSVKNNSISIKFLTYKINGEVTINTSISLFYRVYPTYLEQTKFITENYTTEEKNFELAKIWKRMDYSIKPFRHNIDNNKEYNIDLTEVIEQINRDKEIFLKGQHIYTKDIIDEKSYYAFIESLKSGSAPKFDWNLKLSVTTELFKDQSLDCKYLVNISLINETPENSAYETFIFNANCSIKLNDIELYPFRHEYDYEGYLYTYNNYIRCLNCHANLDHDNNMIVTQHFAKSYQPKLIPKSSIADVFFKFHDLAIDNDLKSLFYLNKIICDYIEHYKENDKHNNMKYSNDTSHLEYLNNRFKEGLELLKTDENALKAFQLLNLTFNKASKYEGWRIFQIFFIVSMIPDIVDKNKRRDLCEVLHVNTGGGKSETYFGCVIFTAFWDRINGKRFGTTAITKFPLRMLSVQQLERIANIMIWAEQIRNEKSIKGEPFSVAYFVGSSDEFPRYTKDLIKKITKANKDKTPIKGQIIDKCPLCNGQVILDINQEGYYIVHKCINCYEEFLLFFTDEEIYRLLPTFIISTVDKFAGISSNRRLRNIFNGKIDKCPKGHGYMPHNDTCEASKDLCGEKGTSVRTNFVTAPTLIIQDEMHLIREGFGTIDSHFESLLETLQKRLSGYGLKNIAMTATITGAKCQIKNLYHKNTNIFPGDCPEGVGSERDVFFGYQKDDNGKTITSRLLIGLKPNLRDNQYSSLLTIKYLSEFITDVESNKEYYASKLKIKTSELENLLNLYKNTLTYHNKKSDVHSMNYYLEAVVNSKLQNNKINSRVLTGDNKLDEIKDLINLIERYYTDPKNSNSLLAVFATSVVSHGVDISNWNFMIFQGIPRSTAEYIQSLSRVGRLHTGIVFVWFYPNRSRDLSFYQNFTEYHSMLQHKVEEVPLSRWAELGLQQTLTSVFCASILNYFSNYIGEPLYKVQKVNEVFSSQKNRQLLIEFIQEAYITNSTMIGASYFKERIPEEVEARLNYLSTYNGGEKNFFPNALADCDNRYFRTQFGMRGIQDEVLIKYSDYDTHFLRSYLRGNNE